MEHLLADEQLKAIIIELNGSGFRYGFDEDRIHEKFLMRGFKPYAYNAFERAITPVEGYGKHNTIYIRDEVFVTDRIKSASPIHLFGESF
jgi:hypothetical protein